MTGHAAKALLMETNGPQLRRALGLPRLTLYGLGTMLGAGIYALVGETAAVAGWQTPLSFLLAGGLAILTALSFAELASRYPMSAGEAVYVDAGFASQRLTQAVGFAVALSGIVSAGALSNAFVGYAGEFIAVPGWLGVGTVVLLIGVIAAWGIGESVTLAAIITVVEVAGLAFIVWAASDSFGNLPAHWPDIVWPVGGHRSAWIGIFSASVLAFYAFIGFEDMVNVAEEVRLPRRVLPKALIIALILTTTVYLAIATVAVLTVDPAMLGRAEAPLALVYETATGRQAYFVSAVSLVAIINGAIIQVIMASRVLYGMARQRWLPLALAYVNPQTRTPLLATAVTMLAVLLLALVFDLAGLARATSLILLVVFTIVNLALIRIKRRPGGESPVFSVPILVPVLGALTSTGVIGFELFRILVL